MWYPVQITGLSIKNVKAFFEFLITATVLIQMVIKQQLQLSR